MMFISCMQKPPGRAKITARLPLNKSALVTSFHVKGLSPPIFSSLTRHLKVTKGATSPSLATMAKPRLAILATVDGAKADAVDSREKMASFLNIVPCSCDYCKYQVHCMHMNMKMKMKLNITNNGVVVVVVVVVVVIVILVVVMQ